MFPSIRFAVLVVATLALAGCGATGSPVDPSAAAQRSASAATDTVMTTTSKTDAERGVHTIGGG